MAIVSANALLEVCGKNGLLEPQQIDEFTRRLPARLQEPKALARELIQRGWVTPYQINLLFQGRAGELTLGPYLLLERLGEGGMGQVFKARHKHMDRLVALKLVRKEHLAKPDAIKRFHREIQAAAALSHPNIVLAYDANKVDDTFFYVMEYVDGTDLKQLVRQQGPLGIEQACDYIRQAAEGLQHAFERGLVHRDIKPSNLLVTRSLPEGNQKQPGSQAVVAQVKILDMGLARLAETLDGKEASGHVTQVGRLVGTPDYIAPEQARDARKADIRADLYSLGGTFYFLLTGRAPFPEGSVLDKVLRHQVEKPVPIEKLRPDVPAEVVAIIDRLMAKKPADRFQTPAEVSAVLAAFLATRPPPPPPAILLPSAAPDADLPVASVPGQSNPLAETVRRYLKDTRNRTRVILIGLGVLILLGLLVVALVSRPSTRSRQWRRDAPTSPSLFQSNRPVGLSPVAAPGKSCLVDAGG
jgi:serine/threonine-protein kinase